MKALFFLSLLANVIFFLWEYRREVLTTAKFEQQTDLSGQTEPIWLLTELPPSAQVPNTEVTVLPQPQVPATEIAKTDTEILTTNTASSESAVAEAEQNQVISADENIPSEAVVTPATSEPVKTFCYQVGEFSSQTSIEDWAKQQEIDSSAIKIINASEPSVSGYILYYPAADTYTESKQNLKKLKTLGLKDIWIFPNGEFKGQISLGLFKEQEQAVNARNRLLDKGIFVEIRNSYSASTQIYAQIKTPASEDELSASLKTVTDKPSVQLLTQCD